MWQIRTSFARVVLFCAVPALAIAVATRQAYLNAFHNLSTWKGGGMGMFAGTDGADSRFTRLYVETPDGRREPIIRLTPASNYLLQRALWYPSEHNFRELALTLRRMSFIASDRPAPVYRVDAEGKVLAPTGKSHLLLNENTLRPAGDTPTWTLVVEYWSLSFDPQTRLAKAVLVDTMRFGPEGS